MKNMVKKAWIERLVLLTIIAVCIVGAVHSLKVDKEVVMEAYRMYGIEKYKSMVNHLYSGLAGVCFLLIVIAFSWLLVTFLGNFEKETSLEGHNIKIITGTWIIKIYVDGCYKGKHFFTRFRNTVEIALNDGKVLIVSSRGNRITIANSSSSVFL